MIEILHFLSLAYVEDGRYAEAEKLAQQSIEVEQGKAAPDDRTFGLAHFIWARALTGQNRYREALPHAEFAAENLSRKAISPAAKTLVAKTQSLLREIREKLREQ